MQYAAYINFNIHRDCMSMQVYALTKERDALRKGTDKLGNYEQLMKDKDAIIKQVGFLVCGCAGGCMRVCNACVCAMHAKYFLWACFCGATCRAHCMWHTS